MKISANNNKNIQNQSGFNNNNNSIELIYLQPQNKLSIVSKLKLYQAA